MDLSRMIGIIAAIGTLIAGVGAFLAEATQYWPGAAKYAAICVFITGLISALTGKVQGSKSE